MEKDEDIFSTTLYYQLELIYEEDINIPFLRENRDLSGVY